ncbi:unnamed protein product [Phytophthora lilii]|uniref:Unnamed protein product n=1 Tax=Phytophthora lilii TaxID=2077276 RepID=A0A9W6TVR8_9STRA|nr:unnamed protein product [Phytophthora lilii]
MHVTNNTHVNEKRHKHSSKRDTSPYLGHELGVLFGLVEYKGPGLRRHAFMLTQQRLRLLRRGAVRGCGVHVHVQRPLAELRVEQHDEQTQDGVAAHEDAHEVGQRALHAEVHEAHDEDEGRAAAVREQEAELLADPRLHVLEAALERQQQQREDAVITVK